MTGFAALPLRHRALFVLLLVGSAWTGFVFATHTATQPAAGGMWLSLIGFVALALVTLYAIGQRKAWAPWTALAVASGMLVIALYGWATKLDAIWPPATAAVAIAAIGVAFLIGEGASASPHPAAADVLCDHFSFPAWVAAGGLFLPAQIDQFLPFKVPPLHARFIGAMYVAGAVMMLLAAASRAWRAVRVATVILAIWTGMLGIVSLLHVTVFDWSWRPTWFWWFAYIWFPIGAAFIAWNQRHETGHADEPPLSPLLRGFLAVQGVGRRRACARAPARAADHDPALAVEHHAAADADLQRAVPRLWRRQPLCRPAAWLERSAHSRDRNARADAGRRR